jgi:hypothetical protein
MAIHIQRRDFIITLGSAGGLAASGGARSNQRYRWLESLKGERQ